MPRKHNRNSLAADLRALGVELGDILFVHSSFKSLGPVEAASTGLSTPSGAATVVAALEDAVGPDGLILMPSFNLIEQELRARTWDVGTSPSTVGYLTEFFRCMPGTYRSDHFSHSVAARGRRADSFVAGHLRNEGLRSPWDLKPWGRMYGTHSPMFKAYQAGGKVLMLGVDYLSSTFMHLAETMRWNERIAEDAAAQYVYTQREVAGAYWDSLGRLARGKVGDSDCRLFGIREFVDTLLEAVRREPDRFLPAGD